MISGPLEGIKLSSRCTISQYLDMVVAQDRVAIADFIEQRFLERYLDPVTVRCNSKNGFSIMAISCLMIEALECFAQGRKDSNKLSKRMFHDFFDRHQQFSSFRAVADDFYVHIRCGILHQAETTGGWRIVRKGPLIEGKVINATQFEGRLRKALSGYSARLKAEDWNSHVWEVFKRKMDFICANASAQ
ncbi:hypothetical protein [Pseudomonas fluorescens]|nr:hypothetical protein [Pseudomonas fluorescens]